MTRWNAPGRARPDEPLATWCEARIEGVCMGRATVRHHIIRRGPGSSDDAFNTIDICDADHRHIHANVAWAKSKGYLRSRPPVQTMLAVAVAALFGEVPDGALANPDGGPGWVLPEVPVEAGVTVYADGPFEPEPWLHRGVRAITTTCRCGVPGNVRNEDGTVACFRCANIDVRSQP